MNKIQRDQAYVSDSDWLYVEREVLEYLRNVWIFSLQDRK